MTSYHRPDPGSSFGHVRQGRKSCSGIMADPRQIAITIVSTSAEGNGRVPADVLKNICLYLIIQLTEPAAGRIVVMRTGVGYTISHEVMRQERIITLLIEGELQYLHPGQIIGVA